MRKCPTVLLLFVVLLPIVSKIVNGKKSSLVRKDTIWGYNTKVKRKKRFKVVTNRGKTELDRLGDTPLCGAARNGEHLNIALRNGGLREARLNGYQKMTFLLQKNDSCRKYTATTRSPQRTILGGEKYRAMLGIVFKGTHLCSQREKPISSVICEKESTGRGAENCLSSFFNKIKKGMNKYVDQVNKYLEEDNMLNFLWVCKNVLCKKKIIFLTFFVMINSAIISITIPRCDNLIFQHVSNRRFDNFGRLLLNCILVRVINMSLCAMRNYIFMITSSDSLKEVKKILFQVYIHKDSEYYDQMDHSEIVNRVTLEAHDFADIIPYYINPFIRNFFSIILNFSYMFYLNYKLSSVIMSCFFISSVLTIISTKLKKRRIKSINREKSRNTKISLEALSNINVIKLFSTELYECSKYSQSLGDILGLQIKKERFNLLHMVISKLFVLVTYLLILVKGDALLRGNEIDRNTFTSFFFYINNIYSYIDILDYYIDICDIVNQYRHIIRLIKERAQTGGGHIEPSASNSSDLGSCPSNNNATAKRMDLHLDRTARSSESDVVLQFKNVFFKYKNTNNYVLKNLNFKILKNTNNVILGKSGGGKSTLLKLMLNFYKCSKGKVYLYNKPISHYRGREIMDKVSYVQQDWKLLKGTIKENLTYGITDDYTNFDMLDLINISKCCTCHEYISRLRKRYETIISNRTELLTSSQKQKICIARALARNPKILLLDESTSAVDKDNERVIFQNIRQNSLFKDLTIIRITHKKANLDLADNIFVLKEGYISRQKNV
ncbi:Transport protein [Plasmodium coatneyi]|uniref:Transport protein n=1 Tax=Plasmodium coatneyi TaxID=208452 RepID=A0A1B1DZR4_9APIC|nr:Transport protein [Plasmodium coatneyi]ANQ08276.1 Transport protein [Plasmodium coatneyi]